MEVSQQKFDILHKILIGLGVIFLTVFLPTLVFLAIGNEVAAAITGTLTVVTIFAITHFAVFAGGAWWARDTMRDGAGLVLQAQDFNDRWDTAKFGHMTRLFNEGVRASRSIQAAETPPLAPPSMATLDWMPSVAVLDEGDGDNWEHQ